MALINCPECNKEISNSAICCPYCGFPIKNEIKRRKLSKKARILLIIIPVFMVLIGICLYFGLQYIKEQEQNKAINVVSSLITNGQIPEAENQFSQMQSKEFSEEQLNELATQFDQYYLELAQTAIESGNFIAVKDAMNNIHGFVDTSSVESDFDYAILDKIDNDVQLINTMIDDCNTFAQECSDVYNGMLYGLYDIDTANNKLLELSLNSNSRKAINYDIIDIKDSIHNLEILFPREIIEDDFLELYDFNMEALTKAYDFSLNFLSDPESQENDLLDLSQTLSNIEEAASNLRSATYAKYAK